MTQRIFLRLPINADEGFPQTFQLTFHQKSYQFLLYVNALEREAELPDDYVFHLPEPGAFMVMRVARAGPGESQVIFQRKLVLNLEYEADEVAFVFRTLEVAKGNLNGAGAFGSQVIGGIASRWDS